LGLYQFDPTPIPGGFAYVFQGRHRQTGEQVGLKVLPDYEHARTDVRRRFEREGALVLQHTNIVRVYDWGKTRDGPTSGEALYILMEWMGGGTLRHRLRTQPTYYVERPREALQVTIGVCRALDFAHNATPRVIHRDVKPENIMFTREGVVKMVDFGIANVADDLRMTEIGTILGTPAYMSPEQARGDVVDHRSDIYSVAAVAYELLTGQRVFVGEQLQVLDQHIHSPIPPPRSRNPRLPLAVDEVLLRALAKDPSRRYQQAMEFATALSQALAL
jgi:serine/threonine-protein kinase